MRYLGERIVVEHNDISSNKPPESINTSGELRGLR